MLQLSLCSHAIFGDDIDIISWDYGMTDGACKEPCKVVPHGPILLCKCDRQGSAAWLTIFSLFACRKEKHVQNGNICISGSTIIQISNQLVTTGECASSACHCWTASRWKAKFCSVWLTAGEMSNIFGCSK